MSAASRSGHRADVDVGRMWRRLRWAYLGVLGAISAILTLGERLDALFRSKTWTYVYVVVDLFKIEIVAAIVLLMICDLGRGRSSLRRMTLFSWVVIAGIGALTVYEARFYVAAKRIYLREYSLRLVLRAEHAFVGGDRVLADMHLAVCVGVLHSEFCGKTRQQLQRRAERAQQLRTYAQELPRGTPVPIEVLETAFLLDRDRLTYERQANQVEQVQADLMKRYLGAAKLIASDELTAARSTLAEIQRMWQGFGDCHLIARELTLLETNAGTDATRTPYVAAVKRYGPEEFVRRTLKFDRPRSPEAALKEGPRRLMFVGSYSD